MHQSVICMIEEIKTSSSIKNNNKAEHTLQHMTDLPRAELVQNSDLARRVDLLGAIDRALHDAASRPPHLWLLGANISETPKKQTKKVKRTRTMKKMLNSAACKKKKNANKFEITHMTKAAHAVGKLGAGQLHGLREASVHINLGRILVPLGVQVANTRRQRGAKAIARHNVGRVLRHAIVDGIEGHDKVIVHLDATRLYEERDKHKLETNTTNIVYFKHVTQFRHTF